MALRLTEAQARQYGLQEKAGGGEAKARSGKGRQKTADIGESFLFEMEAPVVPRPKERPRVFMATSELRKAFLAARGDVDAFLKMVKFKTLTPKATRAYEKELARLASTAMAGRAPLAAPAHVDLVFSVAGDPAEAPVATSDSDLDNLAKAALDALNGVVYEDDRLIVSTSKRKICAGDASVFVRVTNAASS